MIKYTRELKNRGNSGVQLKRPKEMIIKYFINPLKVDLTIIGSLRRTFISRCDTTALT